MTNFAVHHICADLHSRTNMYEMDAKYYLHKLAELHQFGFSVETMPLRQLAVDAANLRTLAGMIDVMYEELSKQVEQKNAS